MSILPDMWSLRLAGQQVLSSRLLSIESCSLPHNVRLSTYQILGSSFCWDVEIKLMHECACRHVVFGRVIGESLLVLRKIENVQTGANNKPKMQVAIAECGEM